MRTSSGKMFGWAAAVIAIALLLGGCGGGGGGGAASTGGPPEPPGKKINVSGTFNTGGGGRAAGRAAAAPLANTSVIAYWIKNGDRDPLNSLADKTDPNGAFNITVDIGTKTNLDVVVEALVSAAGADNNLRVAFDNLAADVANAVADATSTQAADMFILAPDDSLDDIEAVVAVMLENDVSMDGIDTAAEAEALISEVEAAISNCAAITDDATQKNCYVENIDTAGLPADTQAALDDLEVEYKVDVGSASVAETLYALDKSQSLDTIEKIIALAELGTYDNFNNLFSSIDTAAELGEMITTTAAAVTVYESPTVMFGIYDMTKIDIKREILASSAMTNFASNDVTSLLLDIRAALNTKIANNTSDLSAQVTNLDMLSLVSGFDIIEWMFLEVLAEQGFSREDAIEVYDSLIAALGYMGDYSGDASSMSEVMDDWVTMWDLAAFQAELAKVLEPFGMGDTTKTDDLMKMAHDLQALGGATRAQVETVLSGYLTSATTAEAMALYDKYYGSMDCGFDVGTRTITGSNCPSQAEIIGLLETHFGKELPLLDSTVTGLGQWIQSSENDTKILAIGTGYTATQTIYNKMNQSAAVREELSTVVDAAGVSSKMFDLVINVGPYL